jgi:hypothetical protein
MCTHTYVIPDKNVSLLTNYFPSTIELNLKKSGRIKVDDLKSLLTSHINYVLINQKIITEDTYLHLLLSEDIISMMSIWLIFIAVVFTIGVVEECISVEHHTVYCRQYNGPIDSVVSISGSRELEL